MGNGGLKDKPESLCNSYTYVKFNPLGTDQDLPWGADVEADVSAALGEYGRSVSYPPTCKTGLTGTVRFYRKN